MIFLIYHPLFQQKKIRLNFEIHPNCWVDLIEFEDRVVSNLDMSNSDFSPESIDQIEQGAVLYKSTYLEGFYADWAIREREKMRELYLKSIRYLMQYNIQQQNVEKAIQYGLIILSKDPLREDIHREIIRLYRQNGQRNKAIQQYQKCKETLEIELGIPPMQETQNLYNDLVNIDRLEHVPQQKIKIIEMALSHLGLATEEINKVKLYLQKSLSELSQEVKSQKLNNM